MNMRMLKMSLLFLLLAACSADTPPEPAALDLSEVLGGDDTSGYLRADAPRTFSFPQDHGPHPGFRNEWWYFTGNLATAEGRRFGYQVTFFSAALPAFAEATAGQARQAGAESAAGQARQAGAESAAGQARQSDAESAAGQARQSDAEFSAGESAQSAWHSDGIWMAHVALTDVDGEEHYPLERFSRANPGLAGATLAPLHVWLEDWDLRGTDDGNAWALRIADADIELTLDLTALKPPVLQGDAGLSQKSPDSGNASYYYSLTRLDTRGSVRVGDETFAISGESWLDREWSTSALAADQSGWDWFSLQFDDGQELMYYQLRTDSGDVHPNSSGNWTDTAARQTPVSSADVVLEEVDTWTSPGGVAYATAWRLQYADRTWRIEAVLDDQLMSVSIPYWEGAVDVLDDEGTRVGRGYLEMVRQ
jgi:predicted secreted hydrolase